VVEGLDLGGQHAGRGGRRRRGVGSGLEDAHGEPAQRGGPGAGGPDDPAADYGDVNRAHVLALACNPRLHSGVRPGPPGLTEGTMFRSRFGFAVVAGTAWLALDVVFG